MEAILLKNYNFESLEFVPSLQTPTPKDDEILLQHTAIPLTNDDIKFISGHYYPYRTSDQILPKDIPGFAGVGKILALGKNVRGFSLNQRVAYPFGGLGSMCAVRSINQTFCFAIPDKINDMEVAFLIRDGLIAHSCLFQVVSLKKENTILVHDIQNPISQLICSWASNAQLKVIASITQEKHRAIAQNCGAKLILHYKAGDFVEAVHRFTENRGVSALYDTIGKEVFANSIESLRICGAYVQLYGSKDTGPNIDHKKLASKSIFFTIPMVEHYKNNRKDIIVSLANIFDMFSKKVLKVNTIQYPLRQISIANADLKRGEISGMPILIPNL